MYTPVEILPVDIAELTEVKIEGKGVLDVLLRTMDLHVAEQWDKGRIDGPEYAQVYTSLFTATLNASVNYVIQRNKLGYELANLELEGAMIEANIKRTDAEILGIEANTAQTNLITTERIPTEILGIKANTLLTGTQRDNLLEEMTLIPHRISQITAQIAQTTAETTLVNANTSRVQAELAKIPVEIELLRKQSLREDSNILLIGKQIETATLELTKIPVQVELLQAQVVGQTASTEQTTATTTRITRETELRLPVEIANLTKQGQMITAEIALSEARTTEVTANLAKIPVETDYIRAQIANMAKQTLIQEKNLELKSGELDIQAQQILLGLTEIDLKKQQLEVAKEQVAINKAQAELYTAKVTTEKAQTMGDIAQVGSVIDYNNKVLQGQIDGYKNDALQKATKIYLDAWMIGAQSEAREANAVNKLDDPSFGKVMTSMLNEIHIII